MAALYGSRGHRPFLRFVALDVPILAGADIRWRWWTERRERLELLAQAFDVLIALSPVVGPACRQLKRNPPPLVCPMPSRRRSIEP
jgi:hypothetical protein